MVKMKKNALRKPKCYIIAASKTTSRGGGIG